jgi:hypothetical protein
MSEIEIPSPIEAIEKEMNQLEIETPAATPVGELSQALVPISVATLGSIGEETVRTEIVNVPPELILWHLQRRPSPPLAPCQWENKSGTICSKPKAKGDHYFCSTHARFANKEQQIARIRKSLVCAHDSSDEED